MDYGGSHTALPIQLALSPDATTKPHAPRRAKRVPIFVVLLAIAMVGLAALPLVGPAYALGIAFAASAAAVALRRRPGKTTAHESEPTCLLVDEQSIRLARPDASPVLLFTLIPSFGFTLLATADRTRLAIALTTRQGMLCVGSRVGLTDRRRFELLLPHAVTISRDDLAMAAQSPLGEALMVDSTSLLRLIDILTQLDATSLGRLVLTDHRGRDVLLDRERLSTSLGTIRFDQPFEWRALRFREGGGALDAEFQGTWIRQGVQELVLVSLLTNDLRASLHDLRRAGLKPDAMLRQDARLTHATRALPPPMENRVAVDRLFMLSFRRALDAAYVEPRDSIPGDATLE